MIKAILLFLTVLLCLPAWASPININTANQEQLDQALDGIGPALAKRIIRYRRIHGPFKQPEDIQNVPYVGIKTFQKNRDNILVADP